MKIDQLLKSNEVDPFLFKIKNLYDRYELNDFDLEEYFKGNKDEKIFKNKKLKVSKREIEILRKFMEEY